MTLDDLADALMELRRYVRSKPEYVARQLQKLHADLCRPGPFVERTMGLRLAENIVAGRDRIHSNPEMLRGYLYGAAQEIREHARRGGGG